MTTDQVTAIDAAWVETDERQMLREAAADLGARYGVQALVSTDRGGDDLRRLWTEAGELGYVGVSIPEQYGGGGAGLSELTIVLEELATAGCPLLMLVVSPAICGTIISRYGSDAQRERWLPGIADGSRLMAFAITEPDAGSNAHRLSTLARRADDGSGWLLTGRKVYISGLESARDVLVVGRLQDERSGKLRPALFVVPADSPGVEFRPIDMALTSAEEQFELYLDDVRLPDDALVGSPDAGLAPLFAGLNPERIMAGALGIGIARCALQRATRYARERTVWDAPIGAHQGIAHPLAAAHVDVELARLMVQRAAAPFDAGLDERAAEAANMAKYAAAEACARAVDQSVQTLGGHGMATEYGVGPLVSMSRVLRIAPVSREMILNFVAQHSLGLPKSY